MNFITFLKKTKNWFTSEIYAQTAKVFKDLIKNKWRETLELCSTSRTTDFNIDVVGIVWNASMQACWSSPGKGILEAIIFKYCDEQVQMLIVVLWPVNIILDWQHDFFLIFPVSSAKVCALFETVI